MRRINIALSVALSIGMISGVSAKRHELKNKESKGYDKVISFENKVDLKVWEGKKIALNTDHAKHGEHSLKWSFAAGDKLLTQHADILKAVISKEGGMKAWIYNEKPIDGALTIRVANKTLLAQDKAPYEFGFKLNFKGWRAFWVHFKEDATNMQVKANDHDLNTVEIIAPKSAGALFFDHIEFTEEVSWKRSEDQFKIIKNEIDHFGVSHPWEYTNFWSKQPVTSAKPFKWDEKSAQEVKVIEKRYHDWVLGNDPDYAYEPLKIRKQELDKLIAQAKDVFESLNIKRDKKGNLSGTPLYTLREGHQPYMASLSMNVLLQLALDYKVNGNTKSLDDYFLALDYMRDQGWAYGSSMGTIDHELLRHAGYFHSIYLLKDELKKAGRLQEEIKTAQWFLNWNELYNMPDYVGCTADFMRSVFMYRLLIVMCQEDGPEKLRDMTYYSQWINNSMRIASGFADTFKPDFTGYHHRGVYMNAYSPGAFHLASVVSYMLHDTRFEVKPVQLNNLRQALITARIMNCKYSIPLGVCARFPENTSNFSDILPAMGYLIKTNPNDKELLGYFKDWWAPESELFKEELFNKADSRLSFFHTLGAVQMMNEVAEISGTPAESPQGNWFKPYAGLSIHRRDNWMASVKGWSSYIWDFESGKGENVFGRYEGWGALQFFTAGNPVSDRASGYMPDKGWDWSRIPGTTSIKLPLRDMEHNKTGNSAIYKESKHRNFTDQTFLGGVSGSDGNGVFANKIHDTAFNPTFWARKSVFFFDNLIVCLGDGIKNNDAEHGTETTLFQIYDHGKSLVVNGKEAKKGSADFNDKVVFEAPDNNLYLIPNGQQVKFYYGEQKSINESGKGETVGTYYTAWLDHGNAPANATYEYAVIADHKNANLAIDDVAYTVIQKNEDAHIVKRGNQTGYVMWDAEYTLNEGVLASVSTPGLVMITANGKEVELAFSDPDLRRPKMLNISAMAHENVIAESHAQLVRITLNGKYKVDRTSNIKFVGYFGNQTILEVMCKDGATYRGKMIMIK
ncbi:hypothetical protein EYV94_00180 [Puteibacter caeruleilacunae]|nr:hypothetical protein EYV94_00180 [Puteibacter caeruleilacunae]